MPIDIDVLDEKHLSISLVDQRHAQQVNLLCQSLLNSQFERLKNHWKITWHDLVHLRSKMDKMGLNSGRSATDEAIAWFKNQEAEDANIDHIKAGLQNDQLNGIQKLLKTNPYADQLSGIRFLTTRPRAVLADEMGIGKTLQLLSAYAWLKETEGVGPFLVICPNAVKQGWVKEVAKHTNLTVKALGNGSTQLALDFAEYRKNRTDVLVIHFDGMVTVTSKNNKRKKAWSELVEDMLKLPWGGIIIDEAHQAKNLEVKRAKASLYFCQNAKPMKRGQQVRVWLATGTPISESPMDAWAVFSFLEPTIVPKVFNRFESYFTVKAKRNYGNFRFTETVGYRNLGELKQLLHRLMIRRLKSEIKGMPEKVGVVRYVQMTGKQRQLYQDIKKGVYDSVIQEPENKLSIAFAMTKCIRLRQALNHPSIVDKEGGSAKYEELDLILEEVLADPMAKILIWTEYRAAVDMLFERYNEKYGAIKLVGGVTQAEMAELSKNWDTMKQRVAIAIPMFGGTGVDFLQRCRTAVYVEAPYSTIMFRQSADRIHRRIGEIKTEIDKIKSSPCTLIFLQVEDSIDELVYKALGQKGDIVDALLTTDDTLIKLGREELLSYLK